MGFKSGAKRAIAAIGRTAWLAPVIGLPSVRSVLEKLPGGQALYVSGWNLRHPFDRQHGIDTSGMIPSESLVAGDVTVQGAHLYAGSQPGVLREVLKSLPALQGFTFLDFGCGKGRPLFVATEFPFRGIIGVEYSPPLAAVARANADTIARLYPQRTPVRIEIGDATAFRIPDGDVVLYLYNPFGRALIEKVVANVEAALAAAPQRRIFVVYYNPVFGECFDASKQLSRCFARSLPYADEEIGFGPDRADPVVIWQRGDGVPLPGTESEIIVTIPDTRAELAQG